MEVELNYKLYDDKSNIKNEGEARATFDDRYLTLTVMFGDPLLISFTDIVGISDYDYKVDLFLTSKEKLNLWGLGYQYEDFLFQLFKLRNELMLKYLLIDEALLKGGFEAQYNQLDPKGKTIQTGNCEIRLYDTAIVVLPQKSDPIRIPYCYITNIIKEDYTLKISDEFLEKTEFSKLGQNFDPFAKAFSDALNKMMLRTQGNIKVLIPEAAPLAINKLSSLMKDGRAAKRKEIDLQSKDFWDRLEEKLGEAGIIREYEFLNSNAVKDQVCVGIKRGLMGDLTGTYIWLIFPLLNHGTNRLSNTIAIEAFNTQDSADENKKQQNISEKSISQTEESNQNPDEDQKPTTTGATYFFRIMSRKEYSQTKDEYLNIELENFTTNINNAMIDVNFRREPIFLSEEQLDDTKYVQYRFAIKRMPSLRMLRSLFIGRVIHSSHEHWKSNVASLLAFNTKSLDDAEKWKKGDA
jgi:hypothetical protein